MPPRRCLVAPQNTFIENVARLCESQNANFFVANSRIVDHPIVFASEGFCTLTGFSRYELLQKPAILSTMHGDLTTRESKERLASILEEEITDTTEMLIYKKNSKPMWLSLRTSPIKNEKEIVVLILIVVRDITSSKHPIEVDSGALGLGKLARFALSVTRNKVLSSSTTASQATSTTFNNSNNLNNNNIYKSDQSSLNIVPGLLDPTSRIIATSQQDIKQLSLSTSLTISNQISKDKSKSTSTLNQPTAPSVDPTTPWYKQEAPRTPPHIILHYSRFKTSWDWLILFLTVYTCVLVPYTATFHSKTNKNVVLICLDTLVDVFYVVDMFLTFHVTFVGPAGEVVSDPRVIRRTYLKKWFVLDLFACLPYDVFGAFFSSTNKVSIMSDLGLLRLLRITRVGRHVDSYIEYGASVLMLLIVMFVLIAHWFACIWYSIGMIEAKRGTSYGWLRRLAKELDLEYYLRNISSETQDDITEDGIDDNDYNLKQTWRGGPNEIMVYSTALYYTLSSMTSVGFGNVAAYTESEKIFTICMMIFGSLLYATIFGNVTTIFQQMYSSTGRYHEMLKNVKEFMELHDVPESLSERVLDYVVSTWSITKGIDASKVLGYCPADMRADICVHLNRKVFYEQSAFRLASESCLRALAVHFTLSHWAPGDMLFHQGESLESLCFIASGSLEVLQDDEIVAVLSTGDSLGDMFWKEEAVGQCRANVRALTYCNLHLIKREPLLEVLRFYQSFANSFARNLKLTYNLRKRLIFRKIADVIKERELAERTKDNPIELAMNHPVRKLISRFRKMSNLKLNVPPNVMDDSSDAIKEGSTMSIRNSKTDDRRSSKDSNKIYSPKEFASFKNSAQAEKTSLWKLPPHQESSKFPIPKTANNSSKQNLMNKTAADSIRSRDSGIVSDINTGSALQTSSTKVSTGSKWGMLLAGSKAPNDTVQTQSLLKAPSNISDPALGNETSQQANYTLSSLACGDDFDQMSFFEMNCCLRKDMVAINNRMGGIDMRLSQILQMLRDTVNSGQISVENREGIFNQNNQFQSSNELSNSSNKFINRNESNSIDKKESEPVLTTSTSFQETISDTKLDSKSKKESTDRLSSTASCLPSAPQTSYIQSIPGKQISSRTSSDSDKVSHQSSIDSETVKNVNYLSKLRKCNVTNNK